MALHRILAAKDIPPGSARRVAVEGRIIAVFNVNSAFYAIDDTCTHHGASLSEGSVDECSVICPWHGAEFDLRTGEALTPPAFEKVRSYRVAVSGDDISLEIE